MTLFEDSDDAGNVFFLDALYIEREVALCLSVLCVSYRSLRDGYERKRREIQKLSPKRKRAVWEEEFAWYTF